MAKRQSLQWHRMPPLVRQKPTIEKPPPANRQEKRGSGKAEAPEESRATMIQLSARAIKVVLVLNPAEVAAATAPATSRVTLSIDGAQATIAEHGTENLGVFIQGKLVGNTVAEAGLVAQLKKPTTESPQPSKAPPESSTPRRATLADLKEAAQQRKAQATA